MKRFILPEGNYNIGLKVTPFFMPWTKEGKEDFVVELRIFCQPYGRLILQEDRVQILLDSVSKEELIPLIDELFMELRRVRKEAIKIFKDAKAGRITEEFFKNQEVDAEKF